MAFIEQDVAAIGGGRGGYGYPVPVYAGGSNGGYGSGEGSFGIWGILIAVVVLWLLFSRDGNRGGHGGYGDGIDNSFNRYGFGGFGGNYGGNCCSPLDCKIPMAPDMSNCEVDKDIWKLDAHMEKCCCETQKEVHEEGEKTRHLIEANYIQDLRDKLGEKSSEIQALKTQAYTDAKFDALNCKLCKNDTEIDKNFDKLFCNLPMRQPIYCDGIVANTHHADCHDYPRRNNCCDNQCC